MSTENEPDVGVQRYVVDEDEAAPAADAEQQTEESISARVHQWTAVSRRVTRR